MNLPERIKKRMHDLGLRAVDIVKATGKSKGTISLWLSGQSTPRGETLILLSKVLDCPSDWLIAGIGEAPGDGPGRNEVPLISWVQAGESQEAIDAYPVGSGQRFIYCSAKHGPKTYALVVHGESMSPDFIDQDIIFVDPDVHYANRSLVIVRDDDENTVTFKQLIIDNDGNMLRAINPDWPARVIRIRESQRVCGVVIGMWRQINN